jgi:hypothetical protein
MVDPQYYRRQADLCLQLALSHADQQLAFWLIELAESYRARADESAAEHAETSGTNEVDRQYHTGEAPIADRDGTRRLFNRI